MSELDPAVRAHVDELLARLAAAEVALAASQAEARELRVALTEAREGLLCWSQHDHGCPGRAEGDEYCSCGLHVARNAVAAALAAKPSDAALRALLLTAANMGYQDGEAGSARSPADVVDAVLAGR